ncbi:Two-component response regulator SSK1p [Microbotryomycetes sp. JL221]|nr:Two-component response regulator SSK1p [Microbotryomycetes sp. JL221]
MGDSTQAPVRRRPSIHSAAVSSPVENARAPSRVASTSSSLSSGSTLASETPRPSSRSGSTGGGHAQSLRGQFLSRFIGNFRSSSSSSSSSAAASVLGHAAGSAPSGSGRPTLPRSLSSPHQLASIDAPAPIDTSTMSGAWPSSPNETSFAKRFRPSFARRATTAGSGDAAILTSSPQRSPAHSPSIEPASASPRPSPGSPATLRGRDRDPMESAIASGPSSPAATGSGDGYVHHPHAAHHSSILAGRRGSTVSQSTVRPESGVRTPLDEYTSTPGLEPIAEPTAEVPPTFERPLEVITTLLPPTLLLLAQLGPSHLFSPSLSLPSLLEAATFNTTLGSSATSQGSAFSDKASISSMASSTSSFQLFNSSNMSKLCSHELHAPSTLPMPAVSAAAIWRLLRGFEWIGETGLQAPTMISEPTLDEEHEADAPSFEFLSVLQGVADILAADAAAKGVELVAAHAWSGAAPSPVSTPVTEQTPAHGGTKGRKTASETRELWIKGDERAWSVTCAWILHHVIASAAPGSAIALGFGATETEASTSYESPTRPFVDDDPTPRALTWWNVSLAITCVPAINPSSPLASVAPPPSQPPPPFDGSVAKTLFGQLGISMAHTIGEEGNNTWTMSATLASPPAKAPSTEPASSLLSRRRASLDANIGKEPTVGELERFIEKTLKGQKLSLHSGEHSTFAKHLTAYLAGWGMDVQHVPIEATVRGSETVWNQGRREPLGGDSSAAGTDGSSPAPAPVSDPLKIPPPTDVGSMDLSEGSTHLIAIDDDHATLRRLLKAAKMTSPFPPALLAKRPQLGARRTRSSPHVRQLQHLPVVNSNTVIVHFASLTHYKAIKEIVHEMLATTKQPNLPEVLVIPKPAGPRRIVTALWTALRHPPIDPSLPPIATSPTSPGGSYWTPRLSPALAKEQQTEYDFGSIDTASIKEAPFVKPRTPPTHLGPKPRTPPTHYGGTAGTPAHPPSPLGKISDDQVSYFVGVAENMEGSSPSEGMVIQSPDGRPAIFFQPSSKNTRSERSRQSTRQSERRGSSESSATHTTSDQGYPRASMATPHDIGLGHPRRASSGSLSAHSPGENGMPIGTPALTLDSFISAAAKSRSPTDETAPEQAQQQQESMSRHSSGLSRTSSMRASSSSSSPRTAPVAATSYAARRMTQSGSIGAPPTTPAPASPNLVALTGPNSAAPGRQREASAPGLVNPAPPTLAARRSTISVKNRRKSSRRTSMATVPPINVLIVEDNPINQTILSMFMKKKGIKYAVAKDGEEAVQKWKTGNFHLVLMDIQLPVKDGIEATIEIRDMERQNNIGTFVMTPMPTPSDSSSPASSSTQSSTPSTPTTVVSTPSTSPLSMPVIIVALTASSLQADRVKALAAGCNDFLTKPVSLPWLQQKLLEWGSMAYLSGFSSPRSELTSPESGRSASTSPRSRTFRRGYSAGITAKTDMISAQLHIEPKPHGRVSSSTASPAESPSRARGDSESPRSSSPARAGAAAAIALRKERAQKRAAAASAAVAAAAAAAAAAASNPSSTTAPPSATNTPSKEQVPASAVANKAEAGPSFNVIAPTPEATPQTGAPPGAQKSAPPAHDDDDDATITSAGDGKQVRRSSFNATNIDVQRQQKNAMSVASPSSPGSSFPADLSVVDEKLETVAAHQRPAATPLVGGNQSLSDLDLDNVVAEGAKLAGRGRSSSSGESFGQVSAFVLLSHTTKLTRASSTGHVEVL